MGNYTPDYKVEDVTSASIDGLAVAVITVVSFIGVIVLIGIIGYFVKKAKGIRG